MDIATIVSLIEQGVVLIPEFTSFWNTIKADFSAADQATIDAALKTAAAQDAADTAQADKDLTDAAKR